METWEVVVILVLITLSILVLGKQNISYGLMGLLDSTVFQLAVIGAILGLATLSPAVGIVAIATVVIVYYIRNLSKIRMIETEAIVERVVDEMLEESSPRLVINETTPEKPVSSTDLPVVSQPHDPSNKDVIDAAMKEHESRPPFETMTHDVGIKSSHSGGSPPIHEIQTPTHVAVPDPRGAADKAEPFDAHAPVHSPAPSASLETAVVAPNVDSNVFVPAGSSLDGYNEVEAPPAIRSFDDDNGQYDIAARRPQSIHGRYEVSDFTPGKDMGLNEFAPIGASIDDKISNLKSGMITSSAPAPNFDRVVPPRS
jgi:hypothetical protein